MSFEDFNTNNELQFYVDDIFLEIANIGILSKKNISESMWDIFLKPALDKMGIAEENSADLDDFSFVIDPDKGFLVVSYKDHKIEYAISATAWNTYKNEILPRLLEQEKLDKDAFEEQREEFSKLRKLAEDNPIDTKFSKDEYRKITGESIKGDFSVEIVDNKLTVTFYSPAPYVGVEDIREYDLTQY